MSTENRVEQDGIRTETPGIGPTTSADAERIVLPVMEESLSIEKRLVETGRVHVAKTVHEDERVIEASLLREHVTVEQVAVDEEVRGERPVSRYVDDTLVIPILEERLVVEKRLFPKEELRVRREQITVNEPQTVKVRHEEVEVERTGAEPVTDTQAAPYANRR